MINLLNFNKWAEEPRYLCGLMTGTSQDGIDAAIVKIEDENTQQLVCYDSFPFERDFKRKLSALINGKAMIYDYSRLHFILSKLYADAIENLCLEKGFPIAKLDAVGIHGQTIWHEPKARGFANYHASSTWQSGSGPALANLIKVPVVSDFRSADIALGGQGAPLTPIFDFHFLSEEDSDVVALNIGGIANITVLKKGVSEENVIAFDTGPGNMLIDIYMKAYFNRDFDNKGRIAYEGTLNEKLFQFLKDLSFNNINPPKSTGRELFNEKLINPLIEKISRHDDLENIIRTLTEYTAWSIAEHIKAYGGKDVKVIASGGGVKNDFLMEKLHLMLPRAEIMTTNRKSIPSDAKEAMCFAYLAYRTLSGLHGNLPAVTGASGKALLGQIAIP